MKVIDVTQGGSYSGILRFLQSGPMSTDRLSLVHLYGHEVGHDALHGAPV